MEKTKLVIPCYLSADILTKVLLNVYVPAYPINFVQTAKFDWQPKG